VSSLWEIGGYIAAAGGIGGVVAALLSEDKGFVLPTRMTNAAAGRKPADPKVAHLIATAAPSQALQAAQTMDV
jgi:hypothetical protein